MSDRVRLFKEHIYDRCTQYAAIDATFLFTVSKEWFGTKIQNGLDTLGRKCLVVDNRKYLVLHAGVLKWIMQGVFTEQQLDWLCYFVMDNRYTYADVLLEHQPLTNEQIELLLQCHSSARCILERNSDKLTTHHIEIGLKSQWPNVRDAAYNHPCCTEEQRVKYHLMSSI